MKNRSSRISNWVYFALLFWISGSFNLDLTAQTPGASISGIIVNLDGAPLHNARVRLMTVDQIRRGPDSNTISDGQGRFRLSALQPGKYILTISHQYFGPTSKRAVNIKRDEKIDLTIEMGRACGDFEDVKRDEVTEADKAEVINLALKEAFSRLLSADEKKKPVILSTRNLSVEWLSLTESMPFDFMNPETIQRQADQKGDFTYLTVSEFDQIGSCIAVSVEQAWSVGKHSTMTHLSGAGIKFEFRKKDGKWLGEQVLEWVS